MDAECKSADLILERNTHPVDFIERYVFKDYGKPFRAIGFKYFYDHDRHLLDKDAFINYFSRNRDIRFIHVKRKNHLATLYSYKKALALNQWTEENIVSENNQHKNFQISLEASECEKYFADIIRNQNHFDNLFAERSLVVEYEDLTKSPDVVLHKIQTFLSVEPCKLSASLHKMNHQDLKDCILNFSELSRHFSGTPFHHFFD